MTENPVKLDHLLQARENLIEELVGRMPDEHRRLLASFAVRARGRRATDMAFRPSR